MFVNFNNMLQVRSILNMYELNENSYAKIDHS